MWVRRENPYGVREEQEMEPGDILRGKASHGTLTWELKNSVPKGSTYQDTSHAGPVIVGGLYSCLPKTSHVCVSMGLIDVIQKTQRRTGQFESGIGAGERKKLGVEGLAQTGIGSAELGLESRAEGR